MIEVFLVVVACMRPDFTNCEMMDAVKMQNPEQCQMMRPVAAGGYQLFLNESKGKGWLTFTKCQFVNPEKNGKLG